MFKNIFIIITFSSFACFLYGIIYIYYWDIEANICHMTYMYAYPQYMKINVEANSKFPNYGLYYYYEGKPVERAESIVFNGAPIIFIPGNGGSHKQVRSLASVALRKSIDNGMIKKLDYFSIDYNEELNGLHGGFLDVQKLYLNKCINAVLKLYKSKNKSKIILIGHSMGGVLAQTMLADKNIINAINTIIFISSPLSAPVVNLDRNINEFYKKIDINLNQQLGITEVLQEDAKPKENDAMKNILLVSIGGGNRDLLIYESLTMSKYLDLHAMTSSIPEVWLSCDHLSATWCLELMKVINRFLFSILSTRQSVAETQSFIDDKSVRTEKAYHFFAGRSFDQNVEIFSYDNSKEVHIWHEDIRQRFTQNYKHKHKTIHFEMLPLVNLKAAIYISTYIESKDWLYGCLTVEPMKGSYYCAEAVKLSNYVFRLPNTMNENQFGAYLDFTAIPDSNWTHIVIRIPSTKSQQRLTTLNVDVHEPKERVFTIETNELFTLRATTAIKTTQLGATYYRLLLPKLTASYQSLKINLHAQKCTKQTYQYSAKISIPWAQGFEKYFHFTQKAADFIISVPVDAPKGHNITAYPITLELFFNINCQFTVGYQTPFGSNMARIVRTHYGNIPAYITAVLLFTLALQLRWSSSSEKHRSPFYLLQTAGTFLFLLLFLAAIALPLISVGFPKSILLTFILYGTALLISTLLVSATYLLFLIQTFLANKLYLPINFSASLYIISIALFAVSFYFSGGLTLCIGLLFYYINNAAICSKSNSAKKCEYINRQIILCALYLLLALLNLPATIATLKNWQMNPASLKDPTFQPALIVIACLFINWQLRIPTKMRTNRIFSGILFCCALFCIIYCSVSVYRLSFVISFVFGLMLIQHIFSII